VRLIDLVKSRILTMAVSIFIRLYEMKLLPAGSDVYSCIAVYRHFCHVVPFNLIVMV